MQRMERHLEQPRTCPSWSEMWGKLGWMGTGRIRLAGAVAFSTNASFGTWIMKTTGPGINKLELAVIELACKALL